jgi:ankyrin repeat protein
VLLSSLYKFNIKRQNSSALHWAAQGGKLRIVEVMLHYEPDVNAIYGTNTPLVDAAIHGPESIVKILLANPQISVNFQNGKGKCALWCAAAEGYTEIVKDLLQRPDIQVDLPGTEYGVITLTIAVANGHVTIVERLIQTGRADVNALDRWRRTPISSPSFARIRLFSKSCLPTTGSTCPGSVAMAAGPSSTACQRDGQM